MINENRNKRNKFKRDGDSFAMVIGVRASDSGVLISPALRALIIGNELVLVGLTGLDSLSLSLSLPPSYEGLMTRDYGRGGTAAGERKSWRLRVGRLLSLTLSLSRSLAGLSLGTARPLRVSFLGFRSRSFGSHELASSYLEGLFLFDYHQGARCRGGLDLFPF
jgi:hypothetical protein